MDSHRVGERGFDVFEAACWDDGVGRKGPGRPVCTEELLAMRRPMKGSDGCVKRDSMQRGGN